MRNLLNNNDCILISEYRPIKKLKNGEKGLHQNKVESLVIFKDKYDYNGNYISTEKVLIDSYFLSEIRRKIDEIEIDKKEMTYDEDFPF